MSGAAVRRFVVRVGGGFGPRRALPDGGRMEESHGETPGGRAGAYRWNYQEYDCPAEGGGKAGEGSLGAGRRVCPRLEGAGGGGGPGSIL